MSLFTTLLKKSIGDFLRKRKKWLITLGIFIGFLIGLNLLINHYVDKVVGTLIKEFVHEKSNGFYQVEFKEIAYLLNDGRFFMTDFRFGIHPDHQHSIDYKDLKQNYIYLASIPRLHIDIIDFWSVFVHRKLRVIGIDIDSPEIKIINLNKNKSPKKISFEAGNLYEVLSGQLNELKISDFLISDGKFDYETYEGPDYDNFKIKGVTFEVKNFQVNEKANLRTDKFFYTDDIFLEIKDQLFLLKDSIHKVSFDKFYISTRNNELGFENFNLTRRDNPLTNKKAHNHYEVTVPSVRLSGIDFLSAYNNNLLMIDSIEIGDPTIKIKKRTKGRQSDTTRSNLLDIALIYHDYLMIDHFNLTEANLIFTDETQNQPKKYTIDHISAYVSNVEIDNGRNSKYKYGFDFDKVDLVVKNYEVTLPDSINTVKFDEFTITSNPFEVKLKDLVVQPDLSVASPSEKSRIYASFPYIVVSEFDVAKAINKDTFVIEEVYLEDPDIRIEPAISKKPGNQKTTPGGLFGVYKGLQSFSDLFILNKLNIINGKFSLENPPGMNKTDIVLNQINLALENIIVDSLTNTENDLFGSAELSLSLNNSSVKTQPGSIKTGNFKFTSTDGRLKIDNLNMKADSSILHQKLKVNLPELIVTGINTNKILFENEIALDSLKFQNVEILFDLFEKSLPSEKTPKKVSEHLPVITINHLIGIKNDINFKHDGLSIFIADNISFNISKLRVDQSISDKFINQFDYDKIRSISIDNYNFYLTEQNHLLEADHISWSNNNSTFSMENINLKPYGNPNNKYDISIPKIAMTGIDLKGILKGSYYYGNEILIDNPVFNLKLAMGKQENPTNLDLGFIPLLLRNRYLGARANTFNIKNASISFHQKVEKDSLIVEVQNLNFLIDNLEVDSVTEMLPGRFLFANDVRLQGDYLSAYHQSNSDFYNINHYYISTKDGNIRLNGIYYATNTKNESSEKSKVKFTADNLIIQDFDFFNLTQNQTVDISEILIDDAEFHLIPGTGNSNKEGSKLKRNNFQLDHLLFKSIIDTLINFDQFQSTPLTDKEDKEGLNVNSQEFPSDTLLLESISDMLNINAQPGPASENGTNKKADLKASGKEFPFDTLLLKSIDIERILVTDSKVTIENPDELRTGLVMPDIWLLAEGIKLNPKSAKDSNRIFYSDNLMAKIKNFNYVLPNNMSAIRIDELKLNSKDSSIHATNFGLIPLVGRYDYGRVKGYQSTWLQITNDSISFGKVDFLDIFNNNSFNAQTLEVNKLDISVFRDKRIPFPEWQRRPLPQANLRNMNFIFNVDTISLHDGFISYQEHSEKAYTTGEVFFSDLDATILNLTNDSIRTLSSPNARIGVTAKVFGKGNLKAEFLFNLVDMDNIHTYGIVVDPFDLTEFNRILIPSASVQISSGYNQKIIMSAKATEDYSYGEMKFYYEELKIALLNRETETPKGLGNALGSFFANTFIIKSNNPRNLFLRKGDIFFERDKKRAIFNYWTKTFLSGVVSSIGATNNKKKIRKMQEENLKEIQTQKSLEAKF